MDAGRARSIVPTADGFRATAEDRNALEELKRDSSMIKRQPPHINYAAAA